MFKGPWLVVSYRGLIIHNYTAQWGLFHKPIYYKDPYRPIRISQNVRVLLNAAHLASLREKKIRALPKGW